MKSKGTSGHGAGQRGGEIFKFNPHDVVIIGLDTKDGPEHYLYDERIEYPVPEWLIEQLAGEVGQIDPIKFERDGDRVLAVDGRQRVRALRILWDRGIQIMVKGIPVKGSENDLHLVSLAANTRQDDDIMVLARKVDRAVKFGSDESVVATTIGKTVQTIRQWRALLGLSQKVQDSVQRGEISATAAVSLAKLSREEQVKQLGELVANGAKPTVAAAKERVRAARGQAPVITANGKLTLIGAELNKLRDTDHDGDDRADEQTAFDACDKPDLVSALVAISQLLNGVAS